MTAKKRIYENFDDYYHENAEVLSGDFGDYVIVEKYDQVVACNEELKKIIDGFNCDTRRKIRRAIQYTVSRCLGEFASFINKYYSGENTKAHNIEILSVVEKINNEIDRELLSAESHILDL